MIQILKFQDSMLSIMHLNIWTFDNFLELVNWIIRQLVLDMLLGKSSELIQWALSWIFCFLSILKWIDAWTFNTCLDCVWIYMHVCDRTLIWWSDKIKYTENTESPTIQHILAVPETKVSYNIQIVDTCCLRPRDRNLLPSILCPQTQNNFTLLITQPTFRYIILLLDKNK